MPGPPVHEVWSPHSLSHLYTSRPTFCEHTAVTSPGHVQHRAKAHYRNFSCSTLASELCTHLPQSPTVPVSCDQAGRLFRGARAAMFPGGTEQTGTEGPAWQRAPSCHPAHSAADMDQPQQLHTAGYRRAHSHRNAYLTLNALGFRSHCHSSSVGLCNMRPR